MKRWRLLEKRKNKNGKFKKNYRIDQFPLSSLKHEDLFATGGIVTPHGKIVTVGEL